MKTLFKKILMVVALVLALTVATTAFGAVLAGCSEAEKVNYNLSKQAEYFNVERRITVYNARTDMIILQAEGFMNIENNTADELVVTFKTGADTYKINYIYLNEYTLYVVEDITGTHTDPYHYKMFFHTEFPITVETKP